MPEESRSQEPVSSYVEALREGVPFRDANGVIQYPTFRSRPRPTFTLDRFHRVLLTGSVVASLGYTLWTVVRIPSMPDQLPMHFAADGSVTRYGSPWEMLIPASVMLATVIGCAILTRYPRIYNYGFATLTEANTQAHYENGVRMMVWTVLGTAAMHIVALGGIVGDWPVTPAVWIALAAMMGALAFFIVRMSRL
ncbi:hypothetical protein DNL40_10015 [Xylanimonas oleitrophica]|uniref:DUF1648 domain-containing protein n=1 Tax=Xylanimonas oleitrophica TaxID=2607479 RepID=A0A2W5WNP3_9MICO|nr:DUF1648 domain-containing protein [Xylanimonas oleitrophica]PZR52977.1 hypothetical protein DNL40_10015 [Xylanimonas oleitrophica]